MADIRDGVLPALLGLVVAICVGRLVHPKKEDDDNPVRDNLSRMEEFWSMFAGTDVRKNDNHPIIKAIGFLLLLGLLTVIGLKSLYIDVGTFGVNGVFDYLGLFLWGMSSEIAKKTLENVST
jgi:hypothetical protein